MESLSYAACYNPLAMRFIDRPSRSEPRRWLLPIVATGGYHIKMKSVGIKQLKSRLSEYLRIVRSGETVFVTDRDEVVAELRPTRRRLAAADSLDEVFDSLAERGEVTRASVRKPRKKWSAKGLGLSTDSVSALLDEIRSDR